VFYTNIPLKDLQFIAEFILVERSPEGVIINSIGWSNCLYADNKTLYSDLYEGSPRLLLYPSKIITRIFHNYCIIFIKASIRKGARMDYATVKISRSNLASYLQKIIPMNCLCGPADYIAGLRENYLPMKIDKLFEYANEPELPISGIIQPSSKLYINSCAIQVPSTFESRFLTSLQSMYEHQNAKITIEEYRLHIAVHNQWTFVNSKGIKNSITCSFEDGVIRTTGILTVDNSFEGDETSLVFVISAGIKIIRESIEIERIQIPFGEYVYMKKFDPNRKIPGENQEEVLEICGKINTDSEKAISGLHLWNPPEILLNEEWDMMIICDGSPMKIMAPTNKTAVLTPEQEEELKELEKLKENKEKERRSIEDEKEKLYQARQKYIAEMGIKLRQQEEDLKRQRDLMRTTSKNFAQSPKSKPASEAPSSPRFSTKVTIQPHAVSPNKEIQQIATKKLENQNIALQTNILPEPADIEDDFNNELKASIITFEFIGFKPKGKLLTQPELIPNKICLSTKFFNFPTSYSPALALKKIKSHSEAPIGLILSNDIPKWTNISSSDTNSKTLKLQYKYDPGTDPYISIDVLLEDYLRYIARSLLKIYVYSAEGMIPMGSCKIYLADLLRKKETTKIIKKEYDIYSEDRSLIGSLQIILQNTGEKHAEISQSKALLLKTQSNSKKTKVRSKPLTAKELSKIPEISHKFSETQKSQESVEIPKPDDLRKAEIVAKYHEKIILAEQKSSWYNQAIFEDIEKYRSISRSQCLSKKISTKSKEEQIATMPYFLGQLGLCSVVFINPFDKPTVFTIQVNDPDKKGEFELITDPREWKYMCQKGGFEGPFDWNMLVDKNGFMMRANEQIVLLFKVFCLSPPLKNERDISIVIKINSGDQIIQQNVIKACYKETYYNGHYIFNESENKITDLLLVPEIYANVLEKSKITLCSLPNITPVVTDGKIKISYKVPPSPKDQQLYVFVYEDEFYYQTICIISVLIRSHKILEINETAGNRSVHNLSLGSYGLTRTIELYSSNSKTIKVAEGFAERFEIIEGKFCSVPLNITPYKIGKSREFIYCKGMFYMGII